MPWCPKCRNEYQDGITICADCNIPLVDELPDDEDYKAVAYIEEEELAGKLKEYLEFSSIDATVEYDEKEESYAVKVSPDKLAEAKVAFQAFYRVEKSRETALDILTGSEEEKDESESLSEVLDELDEESLSEDEKRILAQAIVSEKVYKPAEVYVTKSAESKDMFSTALTFLGFAVALFILLILSLTKVLTAFSNTASIVTIGVLAIGCCLVGINAIKRSKKAELASHDEEELTGKVKAWLDENISEDTFSELNSEELSEEILYLKRAEIIRNRLNEAFPGMNEDFVDAMIDDFYDIRFGDADETDDNPDPEDIEDSGDTDDPEGSGDSDDSDN